MRLVRARAADRDEPALRQQRLYQGDAAERNSLAFERRPNRLVILIVAQHALWLDGAQTHGMEPVGPLQPRSIRVVVFDENVSGDRLRVEPAYPERGMGDGRDRFAKQTLRSGRRSRGGAIADGDVRASGPQIHHFVVRRHPDVDIGMALLETAETRHDP